MVIGWNAVMVLVMFAFFHHLYMDFVQPRTVQVIGQIASYSSALPAAVVTILGLLAYVYRRKVRWTLASALMFVGTMGWAIGGIAAVIDSTIMVNFRFHNTQWVPAHFHTYLLVGLVPIVLGFAAHFTQQVSGSSERFRTSRVIATLWLVGGYGFVLLFYIGGWHSVPRRYASYPREVAEGTLYARLALALVLLLILALLIYIWEVGKRWLAARAAARGSS
jgi:cytochrome c oxidase subunit 1